MKEKYETPSAEIIVFTGQEQIHMSGFGETETGGDAGDGDIWD